MECEIFVKFTDRHSISNFGRVRTDKSGKVWKPQDRDKRGLGYKSVFIRPKNYFIHRLVAKYFVNNPDQRKFTVVNHKDNNPSNNIWTNLEWVDQKANMQHCLAQGRHTCDNNAEFKNQKQKANTPSKTRIPRKNGLPLGVHAFQTKKGVRYHARFNNTTVGYIGLGSFNTVEEAYTVVKHKYFEIYGVYPEENNK